jgi:hypothetical protein
MEYFQIKHGSGFRIATFLMIWILLKAILLFSGISYEKRAGFSAAQQRPAL